MTTKTIVHFGAGALGRGLVVPLLEESNYDVVLVDVDEKLIAEINREGGYPLFNTDVENDKQHRFVKVKAAVSPIADKESLQCYLSEANVITTSVRRENLIHIGRTLLELLQPGEEKVILCAENIEHAGQFFKEILKGLEKENNREIIPYLTIPDTVVDRICATSWPDNLTAMTENFYEFSVDQRQLSKTNIELIPAIVDLEGAFARKRLMVNTFADASAFLALAKGKTYLHEAIIDPEIQQTLYPYFNSFQSLLVQKYDYRVNELIKWQEVYRKRLSNNGIERELLTVARNLWAKMTLEERFLWPIVELMKLGEDVEDSISVLVDLIKASTHETGETLQPKLEKLWKKGEYGTEIYRLASKYL
ncbi:hypothetical protein [Peribacillus loiseleuriae]|uniref:Mannitol-1-phosphate 5-dehydrogenase n=1 Tax=Peribacillus loiseleuriae TaxID=1679170 RepID=A0A0K9GUT0_9BACI|nr:hypothetical protein [Peribacillus loiseleuriae]KMY49977.1 hypothetical protein AC625_11010 [Peribacillus loiseleuriae]